MNTKNFKQVFLAFVLLISLSSCITSRDWSVEIVKPSEDGDTQVEVQIPALTPSQSLPTWEFSPTATALPINTEAPTPPVTIDADSTVYDNFDNPANDRSIHEGQWRLSTNSSNPAVEQGAGVLSIIDGGEQANSFTVVVARGYDGFILNRPTFFEAEIMLDPSSGVGKIALGLFAESSAGDWFSQCYIYNSGSQAVANCEDTMRDEAFQGRRILIALGTWHRVRIEAYPDTMTFVYFLDGQQIGRNFPTNDDRLAGLKFQFAIPLLKEGNEPMIAKLDNVRIGPITEPASSQGSSVSNQATATTVPATSLPATLSVPANVRWMPTYVFLQSGQTIHITAIGKVNLGGGISEATFGPNGGFGPCKAEDAEEQPCNLVGANYGTLVGYIGNSAPFTIGSEATISAPASGQLYLGINSVSLGDNTGEYTVTIEAR